MATKSLAGGDKLTAKLKELSAQISKAAVVRVGFLENSTEPGVGELPTAAAATFAEFGTVSGKNKTIIPPRPFFRTMIAAKSGEWGNQLGEVLKHNDFNAEKSLELMGMGIGGQLQESIIETNSPPLSPVTVMLRKMRSENQNLVMSGKTVGQAAARVAAGESGGSGTFAKPLVDSGTMLKSVSYQVDDGEMVKVDPDKEVT